jgi:hypothetical protein
MQHIFQPRVLSKLGFTTKINEFLVDVLTLYIERIDAKFVIELKIIYIKKQLFCNFYFAYILLTLNGN